MGAVSRLEAAKELPDLYAPLFFSVYPFAPPDQPSFFQVVLRLIHCDHFCIIQHGDDDDDDGDQQDLYIYGINRGFDPADHTQLPKF